LAKRSVDDFLSHGDPIPVPVFYVLAIYQDAFRAEKRVIEIRTAEPSSPISKGDYLYEVSFPEPLVALRGHILQLVAKQRIISTHPDNEIIHANDDLCKSGSNARRGGNLLTKKDDRIAKVIRVEWPFCCIASFFIWFAATS